MSDDFHKDAELGQALLSALEIAVLVRKGPMRYAFYGEVPYFYSEFFPEAPEGGPCVKPWEYSLMLESFINDCEAFFESDDIGPISSGYWLEDSDDAEEGLPLMAWARKVDEWQILMVQRVGEEYAERARILRQARSMLLERRAMSADLIAFRKKALYDPLTQVYNRNGFTEFLEKLTYAGGNTPGLALLMLDIDDFKKVNDTLGHVAGDRVLTHLGKILRESLRSQDTPVRYGGEEFLVLAPGATLAQAFVLGEKLRYLIENHDFGVNRRITVSVGGTLYNTGESVDSFIARADGALYDSKKSGKNRVSMRDPWTDHPLGPQDFEAYLDNKNH